MPPYLTVSDLHSTWQTDIRTAADTWKNAGTHIYFDKVNTVSPDSRYFNVFDGDNSANPIKLAFGEIRVVWSSQIPFSEYLKSFADPAWTLTFHDPTNPHMAMAALIVFNNLWPYSLQSWAVGRHPNSNEYDLISVATHELGHAIGLIHCTSCDVNMDVMHPDAKVELVKRALSNNDRQELLSRYTVSSTLPPEQPKLQSPSQTNNISLRPLFKWLLVSGANTYYIQVSKYPNFAEFVVNSSVSATNYLPSFSLEPNTQYYWRVKARSLGGNSNWSTRWQFTTTSIKPGDANGDGRVDGVDYVIWLNNYGRMLSGPSNGDFDNNGTVDGVDYVIWLNNYGT